ncbi:hypothetical protein BCY91_14300 [Pelobium manganitolerans]|uniref:Secretion system C-terminal sorting domain-containing protein n=1 Tax=Pelobium manganitolerans TaxID=1842495 RepID=A0A419SA12_9SPHI|nr:T9SS type A sorting domain-containing protein [Pelobium manganitolerans]RKD19043.1 hypothetical protein BCY91_14300 [Pelobium manganitolerans]
MKKLLLITTVMGLCCASGLKAQIAVWNYISPSAPSNYTPTSVDGNAIGSSLLNSGGAIQYKTTAPIGPYASSFPVSSSFSFDGKYLELSIAAKTGTKLNVTGISFDAGRTGEGPTKIDAYYSLDGFSTNTKIGTYENANTTSLTSFNSNTLNVVVNSEQVLTVRFWGYAASGSGSFRINNIVISGASSTLPVTLTSFTAKTLDERILLNWKTASEKNNNHFELYRSGDGETFSYLTSLSAAGNTETEQGYQFIDDNPLTGINYYQLKQVDFDGKSTSVAVTSASLGPDELSLNIICLDKNVSANIFAPANTLAHLALFDTGGNKLFNTNLKLAKGYNKTDCQVFLPTGVYLARLQCVGKTIVQKFVR